MLLTNPDWDPDDLHSPIQPIIPPPLLLDDEIPHTPALPLAVDIPISSLGKSDVYIDDMVTVALGTDDFILKAESAVPLAIHTIGRPVASDEPIHRKNLICFKKLEAEGRLEESKLYLGGSSTLAN